MFSDWSRFGSTGANIVIIIMTERSLYGACYNKNTSAAQHMVKLKDTNLNWNLIWSLKTRIAHVYVWMFKVLLRIGYKPVDNGRLE